MTVTEQQEQRIFCMMFNRLPDGIKDLTLGHYFSLNAKVVGRIVGLRLFENGNIFVKLEEVQT